MSPRDLQLRTSMTAGTMSRRGLVAHAVMLAGGALFAAHAPGMRWTKIAAAQDETVTLTTAFAEISARPGAAVARSAVAEAAAARGAARVQAAAALASAESGGAAIAQGAAASAAADPEQGAVTQGAAATANAASATGDQAGPSPAPKLDLLVRRVPAPAGGGRARGRRVRGGAAAEGGGRGARGARARGGRGGGRERQRERVGRVPSAGVGGEHANRLAALFATASGAAGIAATMLRQRSAIGRLAATSSTGAGTDAKNA